MKKLLLAALVVLTGCASQVPINVQGIERSEQVRLQDLRPAIEEESKVFSLMVTSDAYALYRVAQRLTSPSAVRLLQHRAYERFGQSQPLEVKVHHFVVYQNMQSEFRKGAVGVALGGAVGAAIASGMSADGPGGVHSLVDASGFNSLSGDTEYIRALYSEQENPKRGSVLVAYIESEINGKRVFTRTVMPVKAKEGENPLVNVLDGSIKFHLEQHQMNMLARNKK